MLLASLAAVNPAVAQTSLGWGQHVSRYGSGYVGNVPNTVPMTSYYRSPAITAYGQANTAYYPGAVAPTAAYSPGVSYRVGTPNAAAYSSAYSPIVTPTTPYAANWQYPPQTVMPTVANYAPAPPVYTTNYAATPVTYYRPVTVMSPTGMTQTVMQPCVGNECQAQRKPQGFFGWLFHHNQPTTANYGCASGNCGQPAPLAAPYYTPGPAALGTGGVSVPANVAPSLSGPPPVVSGPAIGSGTTNIVPNTGSGINVQPPSNFGSGGRRADYPPADAYCPPTSSGTSSFMPNVSPSRAGELKPFSPPSDAPSSEPAGETPALNPPSNAPVGSGVQQDTSTQPRGNLRLDNSVTPIPDPEYTNGTRAKAKVNKAPQLLSPARDRTAKATQPEAKLATFEQAAPTTNPSRREVLGDDIWRARKK
jgi:hypothetical protein